MEEAASMFGTFHSAGARGITLLAAALLAAFLLGINFHSLSENGATPAPSSPSPASDANVSIRNLQFDPPTLEIKKGSVVEWKNEDLVPHTATSPNFDSGPLNSGQTWRHTFNEPGTFPYVCTFHPQMKGAVVVK